MKHSEDSKTSADRFVLVGTYKGDQLTDWRGWYNDSNIAKILAATLAANRLKVKVISEDSFWEAA